MTYAAGETPIERLAVVGVAPMAGRGSRLGLSISKELAALSPADVTLKNPQQRVVLSEVMLQRMLDAGIREAVLTVSQSKQDIREHFGSLFRGEVNGQLAEMALSYVTANDSPNTPTSIDVAFDSVHEKVCALGFADILYAACPGYARALARLERSGADVVLGLFPSTQATGSDMVAFDVNGQVTDLYIKKASGKRFAYTWSLAVWQPSFTRFLHEWVARTPHSSHTNRESYVGDVILDAMQAGFQVQAIPVSSRSSLDAGTPESLDAARALWSQFL